MDWSQRKGILEEGKGGEKMGGKEGGEQGGKQGGKEGIPEGFVSRYSHEHLYACRMSYLMIQGNEGTSLH